MFLSSRTYGPLQAADGPDVAQEPQVVHPCFEVTSASKGQQRRYCSCWIHVFFHFYGCCDGSGNEDGWFKSGRRVRKGETWADDPQQ